jgi:hypothetical protein
MRFCGNNSKLSLYVFVSLGLSVLPVSWCLGVVVENVYSPDYWAEVTLTPCSSISVHEVTRVRPFWELGAAGFVQCFHQFRFIKATAKGKQTVLVCWFECYLTKLYHPQTLYSL